jgi:hypothetical protein
MASQQYSGFLVLQPVSYETGCSLQALVVRLAGCKKLAI